MPDLSEDALYEAMVELKRHTNAADKKIFDTPTSITLTRSAIEYLHSLGYDTQEKIEAYVRSLL